MVLFSHTWVLYAMKFYCTVLSSCSYTSTECIMSCLDCTRHMSGSVVILGIVLLDISPLVPSTFIVGLESVVFEGYSY